MTINIDFGEKGVRCHFWQDGGWQPGRAWCVDHRGVGGRCRDYANGGRTPLETHGFWPLDEVRGLEKHLRPVEPVLPLDDRERQLIALRLASPKRANHGKVVQRQHDASACPLFATADQGRLL